MSLKSVLEKLPEQAFLRIHRSFIVAIKKIQRIHNQQVYISDKTLPIGKSYVATVKTLLS